MLKNWIVKKTTKHDDMYIKGADRPMYTRVLDLIPSILIGIGCIGFALMIAGLVALF